MLSQQKSAGGREKHVSQSVFVSAAWSSHSDFKDCITIDFYGQQLFCFDFQIVEDKWIGAIRNRQGPFAERRYVMTLEESHSLCLVESSQQERAGGLHGSKEKNITYVLDLLFACLVGAWQRYMQ